MGLLKEIFAWIMANYEGVIISLVMFVAFAEAVTALTPTKKDDGFVKRLGEWVDALRKFLKVPSVKREQGSLKPSGLHDPKKPPQKE